VTWSCHGYCLLLAYTQMCRTYTRVPKIISQYNCKGRRGTPGDVRAKLRPETSREKRAPRLPPRDRETRPAQVWETQKPAVASSGRPGDPPLAPSADYRPVPAAAPGSGASTRTLRQAVHGRVVQALTSLTPMTIVSGPLPPPQGVTARTLAEPPPIAI